MARRNFLDATRGYFGSRGVRNNRLLNDPRRRRPGYGVRPMTGGPGGLSPAAQLGWQGQLGAFAPPSVPQAPSPLTPPPGYVQSQRGGPRPPAMRAGTSPRQSAFTGPIRHDMMDGKLVEPLGGMVRGAPKQPGFFGRPGVGEAMTTAGAGMMQAASQPGATFLGSLGQGLMLGQKGYTEGKRYRDQQALLASQEERAQAQLGISQSELALKQAALARQGQSVGSLLDVLEITDPAERENFSSMDPATAVEILSTRYRTQSGYGSTSGNIQGSQYLTRLREELAEMDPSDPGYAAKEQELDDAKITILGREQRLAAPALIRTVEWYAEQHGYPSVKAAEAAEPGFIQKYSRMSTGTEGPDVYGGVRMSKAQTSRDSRLTQVWDDWNLGVDGGRASFHRNADTFREVLGNLKGLMESGDIAGSGDWSSDEGSPLAGWLAQNIPFLAAAEMPEHANTLDLVRSVVYQSLKKTLGGQFAEREATALVQAAYNPMLAPSVNLRRIERLMNELASSANAIEAMGAHLEEYGHLANYTHRGAVAAYEAAVDAGTYDALGTQIFRPEDYYLVRADTPEQIAEARSAIVNDISRLSQVQLESLAVDIFGSEPLDRPDRLTPIQRLMLEEVIKRTGGS